MAITKTARVACEIIASGRGTTMFNDKLEDGSRSLKVWGWTDADYRKAKRLLEAQGCKAELVTFRSFRWGGYKMQTRLRVVE